MCVDDSTCLCPCDCRQRYPHPDCQVHGISPEERYGDQLCQMILEETA